MARRGERPDPNLFYDCEICGQAVAKYVSPSRQKLWPGRFCSRTCAGIWRKGENHPRWNNGRYVSTDGYVYIRCEGHAGSDVRGYIREHRLIMEQEIGRPLESSEVVHHINDDTADNRIANLMLFANQAEHKRYENEQRSRRTNGTYAVRH